MTGLVKLGATAVILHLRYLIVMAASFTCKNPMDIRLNHGVRVNKLNGSRVEYDPFPGGFVIKPGDNIQIDFRTSEPSGLIFLAGNFRYEDMSGAFLTRGHLIFARQCGYGRAFELSWERLDNGRWHTLKYIHSLRGGTLLIDDRNPYRRYHMGPCRNFNSVLFGGLSPLQDLGKLSGDDAKDRFSGCLRNMRINGKTPSLHPTYVAVSQCNLP